MDRDIVAWLDTLDYVPAWWWRICGFGVAKRVQDTVALVFVKAGHSRRYDYNDTRIYNRMHRKPMVRLGGMGLF